MSDFDTLCKVLEGLDPATFNSVIEEKSVSIIAGLSDITGDGIDALSIYADFMLCAVAADGKLTEEEFVFIKPILDLISGMDVTFEEADAAFHELGLDKPKEYKAAMDKMVDLIGLISPALKDDIVLVCMMACSVDGKISRKERKWIARLIE